MFKRQNMYNLNGTSCFFYKLNFYYLMYKIIYLQFYKKETNINKAVVCQYHSSEVVTLYTKITFLRYG